MRKARLGYIGVGAFISYQHLPNATHSDKVDIHALCDLSESLLAERQAEYKPSYVTTDYRRLLSDPEIDIVIIGTKQDLHARLAIEALEAGKWVLCEKPLYETEEEGRAVLQAERNAKGRLAVGFNRRFAPSIRKAKELMAQQEGPLFLSHRVVNYVLKKPGDYYSQRERLLYEGSHMFDLANYLMGSYPTAIYSSGDAFDSSYTIVDYADGSRFMLHMGDNGSLLMDKECVELFKGSASISIRDFCDMRIRGVPGEFDTVFPRHLGYLADLAQQGADEVETVVMEATRRYLMEGPRQVEEGWDKVPMEEIRRVGCTVNAKAEMDKLGFKSPVSYREFGMIISDKGWFSALDHFAECFLGGQEPENASAFDGVATYVTSMAGVESMMTGRKINIQTELNTYR